MTFIKKINYSFSILEIMMVIALLTIILTTLIYISFNIYNNDIILNQNVDYIINILNIAKQKSIIQEKNYQWGVILKNNSLSPDYIQLFYDQPNSIEKTFFLDKNINLSNIPTNSTKIITFTKISGETSSTNIEVSFLKNKKIIIINASGLIFATSAF